MHTQYYDWHGTVVEVDVFEGPRDVRHMEPRPDFETIPEGETYYACTLVGSVGAGWWATEKTFWQHAHPISPAAIEYAQEHAP